MIKISELIINLDNLRENILKFKSQFTKINQKICAVVKADAYGLGAEVICEKIEPFVDYFAVSSEDEFLRVRSYINKNILLLTPIYENITMLARLNCEFCISNKSQFLLFLIEAKHNIDVKYKIHIAFNTGMNRFGFDKESEIVSIFKQVQKTQNISISGVFSHFYQGNSELFVNLQSQRFLKLKNKLAKIFSIKDVIFHISNTEGFEYQKNYDMFRIGYGMFYKYNNVITLNSRIIELRKIKKNSTVGYDRKFIADKNMTVAVVSIGYADGLMLKLAEKGRCIINGKFSKILSICMDCCMVDVTNINAGIGDIVTIIGKNGDKQIFICDVASNCDTIGYEIMTRISKRVKRVYLGGNGFENNNGKV